MGGPGVAARVAGKAEGVRVTVLVFIEDHLTRRQSVKRIAATLARMDLPYGEPLLASVIGTREGCGGPPGCRLSSGIASHLQGIELLRIYFMTINVIACKVEEFLAHPEPLFWAFAALGRSAGRTHAEHLAFCRQRLEEADLDDERREILLRFLE